MDAATRAHFVEKGWFVLRDVVSAEQLAALNAIYDEELAKSWDGNSLAHGWENGGMVRPEEERWGYGTGPGTNGRVLWGQPYCEPSSSPLHAAALRSLLPDGLAICVQMI